MNLLSHNKGMGQEKGFAMLFAVLVSSVLLSIGLSIFNLTLKEIVLSSSGRESQYAFYAADTGAECALYWDIKGIEIFATSTSNRNPSTLTPECVVTAATLQPINIDPEIGSLSSTYAQTLFELSIPNTDIRGNSAPLCVSVTITKSAANVGDIVTTEIDSRGYNVACGSTNPNKIERAIRVSY